MKALTLDNIARSFGGLPAVDGVSLQAPPGRITGLIGPNGAGKTTVVNLITGLLKVGGGRILVGDDDMTEADAPTLARAGVARTFQNIRLIGDATVLDNVVAGFHRHEKAGTLANMLGLPSAHHERREFERKAHALLDRFGMTALARHPAGSLSYGHQRRIEMMRALAMEPSVLLLDEPVAGMNDAEAYSLADIFRDVARQGVAILLIEHNMRFVMSLCEHIYVLAFGRLIAEGTPDEVAGNPRVIEAYLGS
ncbi:ABC transporter ATP-binding protein [Kumtagia ephedrae]|jgi:branched-chain amino acid transport system ATP-binding protein|uniref:ABC transporter ATP-binding protein n=1 Tax=Kumtagia ephedrae TaxID=2116701 RepID=A0A2P7SRZ7_9HYPH|nr:ABC transporter ATP-binding protein [Mesorhizobium ephedrae]PSJ65256.1 ABC transporter ATP-binding protein [Mesorhizobium ephedrae]